MPKCPLPFYRVDDKPSRTVKVREGLSLFTVFTRQLSFITIVRTHYIIGASPFTPLSYLPSPYLVFATFSPVGFSHAKVQRSSGVKHHCANGSRICPAAFRKSKMAFQPPPRTSTGWVFREIPRSFACLSVLSPLCWLACKISPAKEAERLRKQGEEKSKFNKLKI